MVSANGKPVIYILPWRGKEPQENEKGLEDSLPENSGDSIPIFLFCLHTGLARKKASRDGNGPKPALQRIPYDLERR
jgi:hypothetical protein